MNADNYRARIALVEQAARLLVIAEPEQLLHDLDHAETIAPIVDPTLHRQARDGAVQVRRLLEAALPLAHLAHDVTRPLSAPTVAVRT